MPQQANPRRSTVMEKIIAKIQSGSLTYDLAIKEVGRTAFDDVIPRFHTIGKDKAIAKERFYEITFGKKLVLKDELFSLQDSDMNA